MIPKYEVRLIFASESAKEYFLGQLSDGWGENYVDLDWDEGEYLSEADEVSVTIIDEYYEGDE